MKKSVKVFGLVAVVACFAMALAACGGGVEGTYKYSFEDEEHKFSYELELKKDDKFEMRTTFEEDGEEGKETVEGTYKVDGEKITLTVNEEGENGEHYTIEGTIKDGVITMEGMELKK